VAAVETVSEGSGVVRLLEKEPTKAERYAHAAELLAIIQRASTPHGGAAAVRIVKQVRAPR
jgi:hypothetical protein